MIVSVDERFDRLAADFVKRRLVESELSTDALAWIESACLDRNSGFRRFERVDNDVSIIAFDENRVRQTEANSDVHALGHFNHLLAQLLRGIQRCSLPVFETLLSA